MERARELDEQASAMLQRLYEDVEISVDVIELLQGGQRESAAALLEAELREDPSDAEVRNAYGLRILPDHPEEGLQEVQTASELGCSPDIVLTNCMFGLFLLQRYAAALEAAERLFQLDQTHGEVYL